MNNMKKKVKVTVKLIFLLCFLSSKVYAQSQIYSNNYKDCMKENFDSHAVDNLKHGYLNMYTKLKNLTKPLNEDELKPIKEELKILTDKILDYIEYLNSIPESYPITDKMIKDNVCKIYFQSNYFIQSVEAVRAYSSKIYIEKELKKYQNK